MFVAGSLPYEVVADAASQLFTRRPEGIADQVRHQQFRAIHWLIEDVCRAHAIRPGLAANRAAAIAQAGAAGAAEAVVHVVEGTVEAAVEFGAMTADVANDLAYFSSRGQFELYSGYLSASGEALESGEVTVGEYYGEVATLGLREPVEATVAYLHPALEISEDEFWTTLGVFGLGLALSRAPEARGAGEGSVRRRRRARRQLPRREAAVAGIHWTRRTAWRPICSRGRGVDLPLWTRDGDSGTGSEDGGTVGW